MDFQLKLYKFSNLKAELNPILLQIVNGTFGEQSQRLNEPNIKALKEKLAKLSQSMIQKLKISRQKFEKLHEIQKEIKQLKDKDQQFENLLIDKIQKFSDMKVNSEERLKSIKVDSPWQQILQIGEKISANLNAPENYTPELNIPAGSPFPSDTEIQESYLAQTYTEYEGKSKEPAIDVVNISSQANCLISQHPIQLRLIAPSNKHFISYTTDSTFPMRFFDQQYQSILDIDHSLELRAISWKGNMRESDLLVKQIGIERGDNQSQNEGISRPQFNPQGNANVRFDDESDYMYNFDNTPVDTPQYGSIHQKQEIQM